jgi:hypothetical protein
MGWLNLIRYKRILGGSRRVDIRWSGIILLFALAANTENLTVGVAYGMKMPLYRWAAEPVHRCGYNAGHPGCLTVRPRISIIYEDTLIRRKLDFRLSKASAP